MNKIAKIVVWFIIGLYSCRDENSDGRLKFLVIDRHCVDLGEVINNKAYPFNVIVKNNSNDTISILGLSKTCECLTTVENLPIQVHPKSSLDLTFEYKNLNADTGRQRQVIIIHSDSDSIFQRVELLTNRQNQA